jgi:hypothetical protein
LLWAIATLKIRKQRNFCLKILEISPVAYVFQICDIQNLGEKKKLNKKKEKLSNLKKKIPKLFYYQKSNKICRKNKHCSRVNPQSSVFKINVIKSDDK